jgi:peptide/nickel transport system permease protein
MTLLRLGLSPILVAFILFSWMPYARLTNARVMQQKKIAYVVAAEAMGATRSRIIWRHLLPNVSTPAIVLAARDMGNLVVLEAALGFVFYSQLPWSQLLISNRDYVLGMGGNPLTYWWTFLPVTLALILFGIGWNLLGDGFNDLLNPRTGPRFGKATAKTGKTRRYRSYQRAPSEKDVALPAYQLAEGSTSSQK